MRLTASGWSRYMGDNIIAKFDLKEKATIVDGQDHAPSRFMDDVVITKGTNVNLYWGNGITLNGRYSFWLSFSKEEIVHLFIQVFGKKISMGKLKNLGIVVDQEEFGDRLRKMTVAQVIEELQRSGSSS